MDIFFPFEVQFVDGAKYNSPEQMYRIQIDFESHNLSAYKVLFDKYGASQGLISLVDVTALIMEENKSELVEHFDFDEESYQLDMYADSEDALQEFASIVCPVYRDLKALERYVSRIADK